MGPGCLMISIVSVTVVGVEVVLALERISRADPSLTAGYRQVFQSKLPVTPYNIIIIYNTACDLCVVCLLPSNLAKKTASPRYM